LRRTVFDEHGGRGARQSLPTDREGGDRQPGALAHGVAEPADRRLRRRLGEAQPALLRHNQPLVRPEARGGGHRLPGAALALLRPEDLRASQLPAQEQHQLLLGPAGQPDERRRDGGGGGRGRGRVRHRGRRRSGESARFRHRHRQGAAARHHQVQLALPPGQSDGRRLLARAVQLLAGRRRHPPQAQQLLEVRVREREREREGEPFCRPHPTTVRARSLPRAGWRRGGSLRNRDSDPPRPRERKRKRKRNYKSPPNEINATPAC
jgi:hypothetical protein